jgi:hypothetical protein
MHSHSAHAQRGAAARGGRCLAAAIGTRRATAAAGVAPGPARGAALRAAAPEVSLPPHLAAELDEIERSAACGVEGTVLVRPVKEGVAKNGKRFHIHTFGCQVSGTSHRGRRQLRNGLVFESVERFAAVGAEPRRAAVAARKRPRRFATETARLQP